MDISIIAAQEKLMNGNDISFDQHELQSWICDWTLKLALKI